MLQRCADCNQDVSNRGIFHLNLFQDLINQRLKKDTKYIFGGVGVGRDFPFFPLLLFIHTMQLSNWGSNCKLFLYFLYELDQFCCMSATTG